LDEGVDANNQGLDILLEGAHSVGDPADGVLEFEMLIAAAKVELGEAFLGEPISECPEPSETERSSDNLATPDGPARIGSLWRFLRQAPSASQETELTMQATTEKGEPIFRGSISRRFTLLSIHLLVFVAIVGALSVYKAHRVARLHTDIGKLGAHIEVLGRLETAIFRLRAESQDALFLGEAFHDLGLAEIPEQIRQQWKHFEELHAHDVHPWETGTSLERALYQELDPRLDKFIAVARSAAGGARPKGVGQREAAFRLDADAHALEDGLERLAALHRDLMADRSRAAAAEVDFILWTNVIFIILLGLTVVLASILFVRHVALPLRRLNTAALDVAGGNFSLQVPVSSRDEIGRLADTFNRMSEALAERDAQLRRRAQETEALRRIGTEISSMLDLDRLLQMIVDSACNLLRTDVVALCLLRDGGPVLDVVATAGPWEPVMGSGPAVCADDLRADCDEACLRCQEARSAAGVTQLTARLKLGDEPLGALCVGSTGQRDFGEAERDLLGGLAAQAAIAIGNARLYERVRGMAAVEERERLAREMHDGLAQALSLLNFKLALTHRLLDGGPVEPVRQELAEMQKVTTGAYAEVRQAIFGLRTMVSRGLGLVPTLSEYLHEFSQQAGIQVSLDIPEEDSQIRIAPEVEVQLIRIVQEALNNIRKHSGARTARVRVWQEGDEVVVAVEDTGVGLDPAGPPADGQRHYGLTGMQERAASVGGTLTLKSTPGKGTQVMLRVRAAGTPRGGVG
jgi:nitrate/nitrite-specific signal transduction histidine kinase